MRAAARPSCLTASPCFRAGRRSKRQIGSGVSPNANLQRQRDTCTASWGKLQEKTQQFSLWRFRSDFPYISGTRSLFRKPAGLVDFRVPLKIASLFALPTSAKTLVRGRLNHKNHPFPQQFGQNENCWKKRGRKTWWHGDQTRKHADPRATRTNRRGFVASKPSLLNGPRVFSWQSWLACGLMADKKPRP